MFWNFPVSLPNPVLHSVLIMRSGHSICVWIEWLDHVSEVLDRSALKWDKKNYVFSWSLLFLFLYGNLGWLYSWFSYWCESYTCFMCRSHQECVWCGMQTMWVIAQWVKSCANINTVHTHTAMVRLQQRCQVSHFKTGYSLGRNTVKAIYGFFNLTCHVYLSNFLQAGWFGVWTLVGARLSTPIQTGPSLLCSGYWISFQGVK